MTRVKIFSDSTCDLPKEEIEKMSVGIIPLIVAFGEETLRDKVDIDTPQVLERIKKTGILPQTAAPSPLDFYEAFRPYVEQDIPVIYIGIATCLSSTVSNALMAATMFPLGTVFVVDSLNLCGGMGALVRMAYRFAAEGDAPAAIIDKIEAIAPNYKLFFTMDKLDLLHKGGRCSGIEFVMGTVLGIKPIIQMTPEGLKVRKKVRGKAKALEEMVQEIAADKERILFDEAHVAAISGSEAERESLITRIKEETGLDTVHCYDVGSTIASHCGDGTVGFGYFLKP